MPSALNTGSKITWSLAEPKDVTRDTPVSHREDGVSTEPHRTGWLSDCIANLGMQGCQPKERVDFGHFQLPG